jgi:aminoglycoside phosphotransferase family enzyme
LFCEQEVTLNRRLSPDIYLGVVKITQEGNRISLNGKGELVEYAVKMKQIPEKFLMDKLLERRQVTPKMIEAVSEKLVKFYFNAETNDLIKSFAKPERVKQDTDENFEQTEKYIDDDSPASLRRSEKQDERIFKAKKGIFYQKIASMNSETATETLRWNISSMERDSILIASNLMSGSLY